MGELQVYLNGRIFGGRRLLKASTEYFDRGAWIDFEAVRTSGRIAFLINGKEIVAASSDAAFEPIGFSPFRSTMHISRFAIEGNLRMITSPKPRGYTIPIVDLAAQKQRQVVVDREAGQYLGHVTTVLLEDNKTMIAVYPKGHGRGAIVMKRSTDGGKTWSKRLPTPESWATSKEVPTIHRVVDAKGVKRLIMFSGLYPARLAVSEDDGKTWSELKPLGDWGGIVVMGDVIALKTPGHYMAMFHDDGRFFTKGGKRYSPRRMIVYTTFSTDGGLTWSFPAKIFERSDVGLCEPGMVRSPDGKQIAVLFRENYRVRNSHLIVSNDEGKTWSDPVELPGALTADRHTLRYAPDGRLVFTGRDTCLDSATSGDWVAWVGTYDDIVKGRPGQYRIRLMDNHHGRDCAYPGMAVLPDGTFVATTYGHWTPGQKPYIVSVRFTLAEIDKLAREDNPVLTDVFREGVDNDGYPRVRIPAVCVTNKGTVLAFAEGRQGGDHSENDIILKRSEDGGRTWGKVQVVDERGTLCLNNPLPVVLRDTGRVLLIYQVFPEDRHGRAIGKHVKLASPGLDGPGVQKCYITHSDDDGKTWSTPRDITAMVKRPKTIESFASGPGVAIQLRRGTHKGRILAPFNESWHVEGKRHFAVYTAYSDDGGTTWKLGASAANGSKGYGNEVQVVERADGSVLLNSRSNSGARLRKTAVSTDGGQTFSPLKDAPALPEPQCQGSILRYTDPLDGRKSRLIFANPASRSGRRNGTIKLSYDEGKTWPVAKTLYPGGYAYSCLTVLPDGTMGCLFERDGYKRITFARFSLKWLTGGKDTLKGKSK